MGVGAAVSARAAVAGVGVEIGFTPVAVYTVAVGVAAVTAG